MNINDNDQCMKMEIEHDEFIQDNNELYQIKNDLKFIKKYLNINTLSNKKIHLNIQCSNCFKYNFTGVRYKCINCFNFNICEICEKKIDGNHDNKHFFIRIHDSELYNKTYQ